VSLWPERAWWSTPREWWQRQPVAHAIGGAVFTAFVLLEAPSLAAWRVLLAVGFFAGWWQLWAWESAPDQGYQLRWVAYDIIVELIVAAAGVALASWLA
jgi:hypothetical protein